MNQNFSRMLLFTLTLVVVCLITRTPVVFADLYKYTDSSGVVNITNKLQSVPKKYRASMKVEREEPKPVQVQQPAPSYQEPAPEPIAAAPVQEPVGKFAELSARFTWFKPLVYLCGVFAALLLVIKVTSQLSSPHLSKAIYFSFFLGVSVFVYQSYVTHVVESSLKVKEQTINMMKKSSVRELPALTGEEVEPVK